MNDSKITQALLRELFEYREDGVFVRKVATSNRVKVGDVAGWKTVGDRYVGLCVNGKKHLMHRMIFLYHHGYLPKCIDHIDGDGSNNRIENLREATQSQNLMNVPGRSGTKSGMKNVYWHSKLHKWAVHAKVGDKVKYFGLYEDIELAELVATEVRNKYHKQFANHNMRSA
jgi:hypothetical protein